MKKYENIPKLIRAALNNDKKGVEDISMLVARQLKKEDKEVYQEIIKILSCSKNDINVYRSLDYSSVPVDKETRYQLVKFEEPIYIDEPILNNQIMNQLNDFIKERTLLKNFLKENVLPSNSILMSGAPGVGKTYIAKWLAFKLDMPIITLDLANSISSYLGRSGQNIKSVFDYAKENNVILFIDEIDAVAKKRDDMSDLGELKRLVNVLLKELEDCPITSIIIGATNHPELLDKAIWRRFDRNLEISLPGKKQREELVYRSISKLVDTINKDVINFLIEGTEYKSGADICRMCDHIKRKMIMYPEEKKEIIILKQYCDFFDLHNKKEKKNICLLLKKLNNNLTILDISKITDIPASTVGRYLKEVKESGK